LAEWAGGVWFCDLADARSLEDLLRSVAATLELPLRGAAPVEAIARALAERGPTLLLLDNFEQLVAHGAATVGVWLERAPDLQVLVTTRALLGLPGEATLPLDPLTTEEGVSLFLARAQAADPGFDPTEAERAEVAQIVDLLDGLPLAIELAAARSRVLPPAKLLSRMGERFRLLVSRSARPGRQATLLATLAWSWDLLSPIEQRALAQLSTFEGSFSLDDAVGVLDVLGAWAEDVVQSLVDQSLVRPRGRGRLQLLVSVQAYAAEKLAAEPSLALDTERRHGAWFAQLGSDDRVRAHYRGEETGHVEALANLVAACRRAALRGDHEVAFACLNAAALVLEQQGPVPLLQALATELSTLPGLSVRHEVLAGRLLGLAHDMLGEPAQAQALYARSLDRALPLGEPRLSGEVRHQMAIVSQRLGDPGAIARSREALADAQEAGDPWLACRARSVLANLLELLGEGAQALQERQAALRLARGLGFVRVEATLLGNLAGREAWLRDAIATARRAHALHQRIGSRQDLIHVSSLLAMMTGLQGHREECLAHATRAQAQARGMGSAWLTATATLGLALARVGRQEWSLALQDLDTLQALSERAGLRYHAALAGLHRARVRELAGQWAEMASALASWERAFADWPGRRALQASWELRRAVLAGALGDRAEARARFSRCAAAPDAEEGMVFRAEHLVAEARFLTRAGDKTAAKRALRAAEPLLAADGYTPDANVVRQARAVQEALSSK
jgi:predicted ATPase